MSIYSKIFGASCAFVTAAGHLKLRGAGVEFGPRLKLFGIPIVSIASGGTIKIGEDVTLISWSCATALGVNHPVVLRAISPQARIVIGDHVGISGGSICAAESVVIGHHSMLGANVTIADTDFHSISPACRRYSNEGIFVSPVEIGPNVFVGTGTIILKGSHVGENSIIGAGSVVTGDIPANCIAAGNPCRVLKSL